MAGPWKEYQTGESTAPAVRAAPSGPWNAYRVRPSGEPPLDRFLSDSDRASPLPDRLIGEGRKIFSDALADAKRDKAADDRPADKSEEAIERAAVQLANQQEQSFGKSGTGELFGSGFTLGLKDKVAGLAGGVSALANTWFGVDGSPLTGRDFTTGYKIARRAQEIIEERARARSGTAGTIAELGGTVATGVLAKAPAAATVVGRVLQGGKEAAALGAYQGLGDSESESLAGVAGDVAQSALISGAAGGALTGAVEAGRGLIGAARAAGRGARQLADDEATRAAQKVYDNLIADGLTPEQAMARMSKRDTALINVGDENTLGLARAASAKPGEGRTTINRALDAQQKASPGKVLDAVTGALGGGDKSFNSRITDMVTTRSNLARSQYGAAFKKNFDAAAEGAETALESLLPRVPSEAVKNAQKIAQTEGRAFGKQLVASIDDASGEVSFRRAPSLEEWHYIQRGLRSATDSAYRSGVGEVGTAYKALHRQILVEMDKASPIYKSARAKYADESSLINALQRGREILDKGTRQNADALVDELKSLSVAEKDMVKIGLARQIQDMIEDTPDEAGNMVKKIFGTQAKRNAIRAVFDTNTAFRKFEVEMGRLAKEGKAYRFVRTGSRTSFVDAEKKGASSLAEAATSAIDVTSGGPGSIVRLVGKMLRDMGEMDVGAAREVAKLLVEKDPEVVRRALAKPVGRAGSQTGHDALLARVRAIVHAGVRGVSAGVGSDLATVRD